MAKQMAEDAGGRVATKSGLMLGLGETIEEVETAMDDLREAGVTVLTLGQYLRPSEKHLPVVDYIRPEVFDELKVTAEAKGFRHVASGPLVQRLREGLAPTPGGPRVMVLLAGPELEKGSAPSSTVAS